MQYFSQRLLLLLLPIYGADIMQIDSTRKYLCALFSCSMSSYIDTQKDESKMN